MPELVAYPTGPFRMGGRVYLAGEPMPGLTQDEIDFYVKRGTVNIVPPLKGSILTRVADTTLRRKNERPPSESQPQKDAGLPASTPASTEPVTPEGGSEPSESAKQLAERSRRAMEALSKGGKNGR